jgi:hypothetical protein
VVAGVEEFPNIEAVQKYVATLNEVKWFRYVEARNVFSSKLESRELIWLVCPYTIFR